MKKQQILDRLNEIIVEEKGSPVKMSDMWTDAQLDSLGTVIVIAMLESEFPFFKEYSDDVDALATIDFQTLTIRELIKKCVSSITNTSSAQQETSDK